MNTTSLTAAVATEHQHQLIADAAEYHRRSRKTSRSHRVSAFLKDLVAASL
jgi:hypothetical protein